MNAFHCDRATTPVLFVVGSADSMASDEKGTKAIG